MQIQASNISLAIEPDYHDATNPTARNSHGARLAEDVGVYVQHQVAAARVLGDETYVLGCLKTGEEVDQERVLHFGGALEYAPFDQQAEELQSVNQVSVYDSIKK